MIVSTDLENEETKVILMVTGVGISLASRRESRTEDGRINLSYYRKAYPCSPEGVVPLGVGPTGFIIGRVKVRFSRLELRGLGSTDLEEVAGEVTT